MNLEEGQIRSWLAVSATDRPNSSVVQPRCCFAVTWLLGGQFPRIVSSAAIPRLESGLESGLKEGNAR